MDKLVAQSRLFRRGDAFGYLEEKDRYLAASNQPTLNFAFIGCGMMGQEHIRNTQLLGRAKVAGVFDPAAGSVRAALSLVGAQPTDAPPPTTYSSMEEACSDPEIDALIIATPNYTHLEVMRVAARYGKAIFLEKPIATTVGDAFEVCKLAAESQGYVQCGLQYRYKAIYAEAISEVFDRKSAGRVHSINMLEHRFPFLDKVGQWNKFNARTGGTLVEKCCHYFDLMNLFAGSPPEQVFAVGNQAVNFKDFSYENHSADGIDQAQVTIRYKNGVIGGFSLCMFAPGSREELTVCGDSGRVHAAEQALLGEENSNRLEVWRGENGASRVTTPTYPAYISRAGHAGSTFFEHCAFTDAVQNPANARNNLPDGFWSVVVGAAAQASIAQGRAVNVEEMLPDGFDVRVLTQNLSTNSRRDFMSVEVSSRSELVFRPV